MLFSAWGPSPDAKHWLCVSTTVVVDSAMVMTFYSAGEEFMEIVVVGDR